MQTETVTPTTDTSLIPKVVAQLREAFDAVAPGPSSGDGGSFSA